MGWILQKDFRFEASHMLPDHDGPCQRLHGHSWIATIMIEGSTLQLSGPKYGMVIDYADISAVVGPILRDQLDHRHLNDTLHVYPTSENIARWLFKTLLPSLPGLIGITIQETATARCTYFPEGKDVVGLITEEKRRT